MNVPVLNKVLIILMLFSLCSPLSSKAYSVLTHEALIDASWDASIKPLLKRKFPNATEEQLKEAHAYAYGGAVAPDMGYYPFGSKLFTNLLHYVRTGDFIEALLNDAQDVNDYAFALGVLCHYNADNYGHHLGVNCCVPLIYPKEKARFGDTVTYAEDHLSHIRTEFAFDVLQTARGNYASTNYHDFIGFKVDIPLLQKAFYQTYGLKMDDIFKNLPRAVSTFRWAVKDLFPEITKAAWVTKKTDIKKINTTVTSRRFIYHMHRKKFNKEFGKQYDHPGFFAHVLAVVIRIMPKIGPLKALKFKAPGPVAEKKFIQSFDTVMVHYAAVLQKLNRTDIHLANTDFDTGKPTKPGEYPLTDESYGDLLLKLKDNDFATVGADLKQNIIQFYSIPNAPIVTKKNPQQWQKVLAALDELKKMQLSMP